MTLVTSADGTRIALHEFGDADGAPVLVVHGFASSAQRNWIDAGWDAAFREAGLRGIAMDLRGHGGSDAPPTGYAVARFLEDVDAVLAHVGTPRPGYLGYSMGARLGWRSAAANPGRFSALVLAGLPAGDPFVGADAAAARCALAGEEEATGATRFVVDLVRLLPDADPNVLVSVAAEVAETPFVPAASVPAEPVLLITGDKDAQAHDSESLVPLLADGRFEPIPGRNHMNAITSRAFKRAATAFLAEHTH